MVQSALKSSYSSDDSSVKGKRWKLRPVSVREQEFMTQRFGLPPALAQFLSARGLTADTVDAFLNPKLKNDMPDPLVLQDMEKGINRLIKAIDRGEKLTIFGDYDVDGGTSSAVLIRYFRMLGIHTVDAYIPDRIKEGYGPNIDAFRTIKANGASLIITVDCGATAHQVLKTAYDEGIDVMVIDHHLMEGEIPIASATINPNRPDDISGLGSLTAVGVCFMVLVALNRALQQNGYIGTGKRFETAPNLLSLLDIVALGTVCDVAVLQGLNRTFVTQGLKVMKDTTNIGLKALFRVAQSALIPTVYHCGFVLGPRINAGGRVGRSEAGVLLLTTEDELQADRLAKELHAYNEERKAIEDGVKDEAIAMVETSAKLQNDSVLVVSGEGWHSGVIGIVSARLKERYQRPALVIGWDEDGIGKGSGRSIDGVHLGSAIHLAKEKGLLVAGGGHAMAAGLTVTKDKFDAFCQFMNDHLGDSVKQAQDQACTWVDSSVALSGATVELAELLERSGPYGTGHPTPLFLIQNVRVSWSKVVGEHHVSCRLTDTSGTNVKAIAFRCMENEMGTLLQEKGHFFDILAEIQVDTWQGQLNPQLIIQDIKKR